MSSLVIAELGTKENPHPYKWGQKDRIKGHYYYSKGNIAKLWNGLALRDPIYQKSYREKNKKKTAERGRKWYENNMELTKKRAKEWKEKNKEKVREGRKICLLYTSPSPRDH